MTKEQAEFFKSATDYAGNQEIDVRDDYSGRGMFGKTTYGIVVSSLTMLLSDCIHYVKEAGLDGNMNILESISDFNDFKTDSMGRDIILY